MSFADPQKNILQMGLHEGMKVADLGSGVGHYALLIAKIVGDTGRVYAIDVQEDALTRLRADAGSHGVKNLETVWGNIEKAGGTMLKDTSLDAVVLSNTLFQLEDKEGALTEIKRILKPGGKLLVIDWAGPYAGMGPHKDYVMSESKAEEFFITRGFHKAKSFRGGPHHYAIVFTLPL